MKILKKYFSNIVKTTEPEIPPSKHTFQNYLKKCNKKYFTQKSNNKRRNRTRNKITQNE